MFRRLALASLALVALFGSSGCDSGQSSAGAGGSTGTPGTMRGCAVDTPPPVAPGGYYTNGTSVCTADGTPHLFHGVARPSMEWGDGENLNQADFSAMGDWHANVVRVALNQDFWLSGAAQFKPGYAASVDQVIHFAETAGLDVILDLHWSDRGDLTVPTSGGKQGIAGTSNQQQMADVNSVKFWSEVAGRYKDDGHVMFELYNEPHDISWSVWLNGGGVAAANYTAVGMQALYKAVRDAGANNVVIAGGLGYAFDLSGVGGTPIKGYNVIYASHPYKPQDPQTRWESAFGYLATRDIAPVILTEFGDTQTSCTGDWDTQLIQFADSHQISWTAWAWFPGGCGFPALLSSWDHTPTVQGVAVQAALLAYPYEPAGNVDPDAGTGDDAGTSGDAGATSSGGAPAEAGGAFNGGAPTDIGTGGAAGSPLQ